MSLVLLGLFIAARLIELAYSRPRAAAALQEPWWPAMVAVHSGVLGGCVIHFLAIGNRAPPWLLAIALAALAVAVALRVWVLRTLRERWNVRVVDPSAIATGGPYRFIRHPNYLAVILEIAALPLAVGAYEIALLGSLANAVVLSLRIPFEERLLARHPEYGAVMQKPRFIPRRLC